ncbi:ANTAR domain-containing protein [Streptomyces sp. NPDC046939]|uniref:ANTAR domain-containing protein n=1 Tax=Streptomyces sp. NPDC046939 TaxID=3155376 RepID=UPI0033F091F5
MTTTTKPATQPQEREDSAARVAELEGEIAQLREAVTAHAEVDQAIGVVMALAHVPPARAWDILVAVSQHTNTRLRRVAALLVQWPHTPSVLPPALHTELVRQLGSGHR